MSLAILIPAIVLWIACAIAGSLLLAADASPRAFLAMAAGWMAVAVVFATADRGFGISIYQSSPHRACPFAYDLDPWIFGGGSLLASSMVFALRIRRGCAWPVVLVLSSVATMGVLWLGLGYWIE